MGQFETIVENDEKINNKLLNFEIIWVKRFTWCVEFEDHNSVVAICQNYEHQAPYPKREAKKCRFFNFARHVARLLKERG